MPVLVLALDGATFDVIRPVAACGRLPNLAAWTAAGLAAPLPSTVPPVTFPAWSTFLTGTDPGEHGIFDFTQKVDGAYRVRFVNASDRAGETLFGRVSRAGGSVLVLGMPATFPPPPVRGLVVAGFDAPVSSGTDAACASDPALYARIAQRAGPWMRPELNESAAEGDFHERALATLLARVERKTAFALEALRAHESDHGGRPDLAVVVFSESDTVGHHYWRDHDPASPRHDPAAGPERRDAVARVYEALDAACGELRRAFGEDAPCLVVSDHGMGGASRRVVHPNRYLERAGLLRRTGGALALDHAARRARDRALRWLPPRVSQAVFRRARGAAARLESAARFGGHDWSRTLAFSEEANTQPGVWINLRGREAAGCVAPDDYERVRDDVIAALGAWRLPAEGGAGGGPVVERARRREEVYAGPFVARAPDVVVELALDAGYGLSLVPTPWSEHSEPLTTLAPDALAGGRGRGMNGTHRPDGVCIATDPSLRAALPTQPRLGDVAPAILEVLGVGAEPAAPAASGPRRRGYTPEEDERVAARLRALGYLE